MVTPRGTFLTSLLLMVVCCLTRGKDFDPPKLFDEHCIVNSGNMYYDPSYGTAPIANAKAYEDSAFAGYGKRIQNVPLNENLEAYQNDTATTSGSEVDIN